MKTLNLKVKLNPFHAFKCRAMLPSFVAICMECQQVILLDSQHSNEKQTSKDCTIVQRNERARNKLNFIECCVVFLSSKSQQIFFLHKKALNRTA